MDFAPYIKEIGRGAKGSRHLSRDDARILFNAILEGIVPPLELGAMLLSMRIKGESVEELLGFKQALDAYTPQIKLLPDKPYCLILSTYNGARRQPNFAPLLALLLARQGIPVLVHGHHDFDNRVNPINLYARLGVKSAASIDEASDLLAERGIAFLPLEVLCPQLDALLSLRPRLGVRNSGHTLVKLIDPCRGRSVRLVAVTHPEYLTLMREFLLADGGRSLLMRGTEGEAYANPKRRPQIERFVDGCREIACSQEEIDAASITWTATPALEHNVELIQGMLAGNYPIPKPILDQFECCVNVAGLSACASP